ncbi:MAG: hypothetical protein ACR2QC_06765, partial [Gammaproteobacteria bacterium]
MTAIRRRTQNAPPKMAGRFFRRLFLFRPVSFSEPKSDDGTDKGGQPSRGERNDEFCTHKNSSLRLGGSGFVAGETLVERANVGADVVNIRPD